MCAGGQKWDHLVINEFVLPSRSKTDEPSCEDSELLGHISLKDHCTLNMQTKKKKITKNPSEDFVLEAAVPFFSERLSHCSVALLNIIEQLILYLLAFEKCP